MSDWAVGDLAVCVDASHRPRTSGIAALLLEKGKTYEVIGTAIGFWEPDNREQLGLVLAGCLNPLSFDGDWPADRFRKIRPDAHERCEDEFIPLIQRKRVSA